MTLTLASFPAAEARERSLVPPCLQQRAPLNYEIRDEHHRRLHPTLAGYKLRWGQTYSLRIRTQDRDPSSWTMRLLAPRSIIESPEKDEVDGDARVLTFETKALWKWFSKEAVFPVRLDFADGREPWQFSIPVILKASRFRWIVYLLGTAVLSYLSQVWYRESLALPNLDNLVWAAIIWLVVVVGSILMDQWTFYRRALRQLRESRKPVTANSPG